MVTKKIIKIKELVCQKCGNKKNKENMVPFEDGFICKECLEKLDYEPITCPVCKTTVNFTSEGEANNKYLGIFIKSDILVKDTVKTDTLLFHICPNCKTLFCDQTAYSLAVGQAFLERITNKTL